MHYFNNSLPNSSPHQDFSPPRPPFPQISCLRRDPPKIGTVLLCKIGANFCRSINEVQKLAKRRTSKKCDIIMRKPPNFHDICDNT